MWHHQNAKRKCKTVQQSETTRLVQKQKSSRSTKNSKVNYRERDRENHVTSYRNIVYIHVSQPIILIGFLLVPLASIRFVRVWNWLDNLRVNGNQSGENTRKWLAHSRLSNDSHTRDSTLADDSHTRDSTLANDSHTRDSTLASRVMLLEDGTVVLSMFILVGDQSFPSLTKRTFILFTNL